jgi:hypothetical protein
MPALLETLLAVLLCVCVAFLPPWLVALIWLGALSAFGASFAFERRGQGRAPHFLRALSGLMPVSLAVSLAVWVWPLHGPWLALPMAFSSLILGVLLHGRVFAWMLRPARDLGARYPFTNEHALSGAGGHVWSRLPGSGLRFRMVPGIKPRSSQPQGCTWVFEDGHVLEGRDRSLHVSRDGRWLVVRALRGGGVLALDRQHARRYVWDEGAELWSAIEANERWPRAIESYRAKADLDLQLMLRFGLWITEAEWLQAAPERLDVPDPSGRPRLQFMARREPQQIAEALQPLRYALQPAYAVLFDGVALPFAVLSPESAVWRADGRALLLAPDDALGLWLHEDGRTPRRFSLRWDVDHGHPALSLGRVRVLESERFGVELRQGRVSAGYPQQWDAASAEAGYGFAQGQPWAIAQPDGAARYTERDLPGQALLWLRLGDPEDLDQGAEVESLGPGGRVVLFQRQADRCWRARLDGETLPVSPLSLAHLWSDDGRHLIVQPASLDTAVPETCMVVDTRSRAILPCPAQGFDLRPVAMCDGVLQVRRALGRVPAAAPTAELQRLPPIAAQGRSFLLLSPNSWLRFACDRYALNEDGSALVGPLSRAVRVRVPPSPLACFDLIYASPSGGWAHLHGARGRYDDPGPRPQDARFGAYVCTHSGLACAGMSPSMIWSADGRWLLLVHAPDPASPSWTPWLLDLENERLLRPHPDEPGQGTLPGMPFFLNFHGGVVRYESVEQAWWSQGVTRRSGVLPLESMLARFQSVDLVVAGGIKVAPDQVRGHDWRNVAQRATRALA